MTSTVSPSPRYAGAMIVLALVLGGGAGQGIWTDHLMELLLVPALFFGVAGFRSSCLDTPARILAIMVLVTLAIQFVPVSRTVPLIGMSGFGFWSEAPQKSLEAALFAIGALGFFLYVALMGEGARARLLPYFYVGLFIQAAVAIVQLSFSRAATLTGILPFEATAAIFANENHFSSLFFAMIPLLAYSLIVRMESILSYVIVSLLMVGLLFAVGSRAGMGISSAIAILSLVWFLPLRNKLVMKITALGAGAIGLIGAILMFGSSSSLEVEQRWILFATTWDAIRDHWLTGTGLGTFTLIYPAYEETVRVIRYYANHAHNDFLEILLELGLAGAVLMVLFFVLLIRGAFRSDLSQAAFLSILALMVHSIVDYPLRTMALAMTLAYLCALVLARADGPPDDEKLRKRAVH